MERPRIGRKARERLEELKDPFSREPVGDGEERGSASVTKVLQQDLLVEAPRPSRGDDANPRPREPRFDELLREMIARRDQEVRSSEREPIERRLGPRANSCRGRCRQAADGGWRSTERGDGESPGPGPANAAAIESSRTALARCFSVRRSNAAPRRAASGNGHSGNERKRIRASCAGAASAIRRWYRYPPLRRRGSPSVISGRTRCG